MRKYPLKTTMLILAVTPIHIIQKFHCFHIPHSLSQDNNLSQQRMYYPSHTGQTDTKQTSNRQKLSNLVRDRFAVGIDSVLSIWCWFMFRQTNLCLKDLSPTNCRLSVGYMSVWCRFCRGAFGDVSVLIRPRMVDGLSVLDRLCIGHMSADLTPIQGRFKTESSPT